MGKPKRTPEFIENSFKEKGYTLLPGQDYKNNRTKLDYLCSCGSKQRCSFNTLRNRDKCPECRGGNKYKFSYEYVKSVFEARGCTLLSETYESNGKHLNYICSCGETNTSTFSNFQVGKGCQVCGRRKAQKTVEETWDRKGRAKPKEVYEKRNQRLKVKYDSDINYRLARRIGGRIREAIKLGRGQKNSKSLHLLGCSIEELKIHLESQFKPGMTWQNHGHKGWCLDHIIPCVSFDLTKEEEQRKCFHYTNLQPLWAKENCGKCDRMPDGTRGRDIKNQRLSSPLH